MNHDAAALAVVKRFLDGEGATLEGAGNQPLAPTRVENGIKIFQLTIDKILHRIDAVTDPIAALGYNGTWPAPRIEVVEGDRIRAVFRNNLDESTGVHFHGQRVPNAMDGVPHITQDPIEPGASFAYEFEVRTPGSHMCTTRTTMRPTRSGGVCSGRSSSSRRTRRTGTTASTA